MRDLLDGMGHEEPEPGPPVLPNDGDKVRVGDYEVRNWRGWMQQRVVGYGRPGRWQFYIVGFGGGHSGEWGEASVMGFDYAGRMSSRTVRMDPKDRLLIEGRKFGRDHWCH